MSEITQQEAHLVVAAIRILSHGNEQPPRPAEIAEMLGLPEAVLRMRVASLAELGIVTQVESAFEDHVEIRDHLKIEELAAVDDSPELTEDLAAFDRRKQEEAEKMQRLFSDGEHERKRSEKLDKMDEDLKDFRNRKPPNPFGDD